MPEYPLLETLGERLRWARERKSWTQEELAEKSAVSRDVIAQTEVNRTKQPKEIIKLCDALDVSPAWLVFGIEDIDALSKEAIELAIEWSRMADDDAQKEALRQAILAARKSE